MRSKRGAIVGILILGLGLWTCKPIEEPPEVPQYWEPRRTWEIQGVLLKLFEITPGDSLICVTAHRQGVRFWQEPLGLQGRVPADSLHPLYDALWLGDKAFIARVGSSLVRVTLTDSETPQVDTLESPTDLLYLASIPGDTEAFLAVPENSSVFQRVSLPTLERTPEFTGISPPEHGFEVQGPWVLDHRGILYDMQGQVLFQDTTLGRFVTFGPDSWLIFVPPGTQEYLGLIHWATHDTQWVFLPNIQRPMVPYWRHGTFYFMTETLAPTNWWTFFFDFVFFMFFRIWPVDLESPHQYHFYVYTGPEVWQATTPAGAQSVVPVRRYFLTPSSKISPP